MPVVESARRGAKAGEVSLVALTEKEPPEEEFACSPPELIVNRGVVLVFRTNVLAPDTLNPFAGATVFVTFNPPTFRMLDIVPVPVAHRASVPIVQPLIAIDVADAIPRLGVINEGEVCSTTVLPVPVTALTVLLLICKVLPVPAVLKVLLVNVSVVLAPTTLSVAARKVHTEEPKAPVFGWIVTVPVLRFWKPIEPIAVPATPNTGVRVLEIVPELL